MIQININTDIKKIEEKLEQLKEELKYFWGNNGNIIRIKNDTNFWEGMKLQCVTGQQKKQRKLQQININIYQTIANIYQ